VQTIEIFDQKNCCHQDDDCGKKSNAECRSIDKMDCGVCMCAEGFKKQGARCVESGKPKEKTTRAPKEYKKMFKN